MQASQPLHVYACTSIGIHDIVLVPLVVDVQSLPSMIPTETSQNTLHDKSKLNYTNAWCCKSRVTRMALRMLRVKSLCAGPADLHTLLGYPQQLQKFLHTFGIVYLMLGEHAKPTRTPPKRAQGVQESPPTTNSATHPQTSTQVYKYVLPDVTTQHHKRHSFQITYEEPKHTA